MFDAKSSIVLNQKHINFVIVSCFVAAFNMPLLLKKERKKKEKKKKRREKQGRERVRGEKK